MGERLSSERGDASSQGPSSADGFDLSRAGSLPSAAPYVAKTKRWALVAVVVVSFVLAAWVAAPLWVAVLLGVVMATSTQRLFALLALLGGIEVFGLAGLIVAPIVMSVFVAAFRLYEREVRSGTVPATTHA